MKKIILFSALSLSILTAFASAQADSKQIIKNDTDGTMTLSKISYCGGHESAKDLFPHQIAAHEEKAFSKAVVKEVAHRCIATYTTTNKQGSKHLLLINYNPNKNSTCKVIGLKKGNPVTTCTVSKIGKDDYTFTFTEHPKKG